MQIRPEQVGDAEAIRAVTTAAFAGAPHSSGTEADIVDALRVAGDLTLSLVAMDAGEVVGHVAFSPVTIGGHAAGWFGLGPVAVRPDRQGAGVGRALIEAGLGQLRGLGAEPGYYGRFGFEADPRLIYDGAPAPYFQRLAFGGEVPEGKAAYRPAFG